MFTIPSLKFCTLNYKNRDDEQNCNKLRYQYFLPKLKIRKFTKQILCFRFLDFYVTITYLLWKLASTVNSTKYR